MIKTAEEIRAMDAELDNKLKALRSRNNSAGGDNPDVRDISSSEALTNIRIVIENLQQDNAGWRVICKDAHTTIAQLQDEIKYLRHELCNKHDIIKELKDEHARAIEELQTNNAHKNSAIEAMNEENNHLLDRVSDLEAKIENFQQNNRDLQETIRQLFFNRLQPTDSAADGEESENPSDLLGTMEDLMAELERKDKCIVDVRQECLEKEKFLKYEIHRQKEDCWWWEDRSLYYERKYHEALTENNKQLNQYRKSTDTIRDLQIQAIGYESNIKDLKNALKQTEETRLEIQRYEVKIEQLTAEYKAAIADIYKLERKICRLEEENYSLKANDNRFFLPSGAHTDSKFCP